MSSIAILLILTLIGILGHSNNIATAGCVLLFLKLTNLDFLYSGLEKHGLEIGLLFLIIAILSPLAAGKISSKDIAYNLSSVPGLMAIAGGALATHLNEDGLNLLIINPAIIFGLVLGSIIGIVFLNGQPVGPLMAAGITALFLNVIYLFF